jgi:hypothetical protein|tara:strand:+ start:711 stop:2153 length:1443 start_codon:yes stop_codon:yes gene_type:complete
VYFRDNNYSDGIDRFMVITVATENNKELDRFRESCHHYNIPYKILGLGQEWTGGEAKNGVLLKPGGSQKINLLKEELKGYPDLGNHIILFTDSYDVIFNGTSEEIVNRFREMESPMVFSAEKTCWPDESLKERYPKSPTEYKYLNSGGFIGYGDHISKLINKVEVSNEFDDQLYYTERYFEELKGDKDIILDYKQFLFQTMNESLDDIIIKDNKFINDRTKQSPLIIHANGGTEVKNKLNDYYNKLFNKPVKHKVTNKDYVDDKVESGPKEESEIIIGLFLDEKVLDINQTFDHIRFLNYPKNKTTFHIIYSNVEYSYKVNMFKEKYSNLFKDFKVTITEDNKVISRKKFLIDSYDNTDYVIMMESNHIFRNIKSLQLLLNECKGIITPMINKEGSEWVNFNSKLKEEYRKYGKRGVWDVETAYGIHIINNDTIPFCVRSLFIDSEKYDDGDWDVLLCENLNKEGHSVQISNTNYYGGII